MATKDWIRTSADEVAASRGCYFDEEKAEGVCRFLAEELRHTMGRWDGQPFEPLPWQRDRVIYPLFGWMRPDGKRRHRVSYIEVAKKNGKSTLASALALYLLVADGEPGSQVFCAASDRHQAGIVYREASEMVKRSRSLTGHLNLINSTKTIVFGMGGGFIRALSSDAFRAEGLNIHGLIFDELHAQPNRGLWDALRYGGAAREQPLLISITTAGYDRNSICWEQHQYARKILDGDITEDISFFPCIFAADEGDDWTAEDTWHKANPSLGDTMDLEQYRADCLEAQESPTKENSFKRYRLNIWTEQNSRWLQMAKWDECKATPEIEPKAKCFMGLDLSSTTDISALAMYFPETGAVSMRFWIPEEGMAQRVKKDRVPYDVWARKGFITATPGNVIDYEYIRNEINDLCGVYDVKEIAYDPWNATQLATQLYDTDGLPMVQHRQGYASMSEPTKNLEALVLKQAISHGGNPVLRWMASNVSIKSDPSGNIRIDKEKATEKVDGMVALVMATGGAIRAADKGPSVYQSRGIMSL